MITQINKKQNNISLLYFLPASDTAILPGKLSEVPNMQCLFSYIRSDLSDVG